jgi:hypothetical protein
MMPNGTVGTYPISLNLLVEYELLLYPRYTVDALFGFSFQPPILPNFLPLIERWHRQDLRTWRSSQPFESGSSG